MTCGDKKGCSWHYVKILPPRECGDFSVMTWMSLSPHVQSGEQLIPAHTLVWCLDWKGTPDKFWQRKINISVTGDNQVASLWEILQTIKSDTKKKTAHSRLRRVSDDIGKRHRQCLVPWDATTCDEWWGGRKSATPKTALPFIALIWIYRQRRGISFAGRSSPFA